MLALYFCTINNCKTENVYLKYTNLECNKACVPKFRDECLTQVAFFLCCCTLFDHIWIYKSVSYLQVP